MGNSQASAASGTPRPRRLCRGRRTTRQTGCCPAVRRRPREQVGFIATTRRSGVVLAANHNYRVAVGMYTPGYVWYSGAQGYWLVDGGGYASVGNGAAHGAGNGIISCVACGLSPNPLSPCAQDTSGGWAYPNSVEDDGDNYYIDLEVSAGGW